MNRRMVLGLILIGCILAAVGARAAGATSPAGAAPAAPVAGVRGAPAAPAAAAEVPDLNGDWRLDPARSDVPLRPPGGPDSQEARGGHGGWGGHAGGGGEGRHGGGGGHHGDGEGRGGPETRPARLPDVMHVTQTKSVVSFEDTSGHVIREITTVAAAADTFAHAPGAQLLSGQWSGSQLVVQHAATSGFKLTETIALEDGGRSLVIDTKVESNGSTPAREFKRVYERMPSS